MVSRAQSAILAESNSYFVDAKLRSYKHQYSNIYFVRLQHLRHTVEEQAKRKWENITGSPILIPRVLDVIKSQICYVVGTVYIDMPLKPNVLEDISRDQSIPAPPLRDKFHSNNDAVMLEDESGRIRLVGERLKDSGLVTGVIIGVLGAETPNGDFEVVDLCYPELAHQHTTSEIMNGRSSPNARADDKSSWLAVTSGLNVGIDDSTDSAIELLAEYLAGEVGGNEETASATSITRLLIAGNSLSHSGSFQATGGSLDSAEDSTEKKTKRYGHDNLSFSSKPITTLSGYLLDIARSMPVHILPGPSDPSGTILPQQSFPRAMFGQVASLDTFVCETNPTSIKISTATLDENVRTILIHSGQPLDDMFKYVPTPPSTRLSLAESTLRWRHIAPTAPDTLWCHPYFTGDPFILHETPDLYLIGNQPRFETKMVTDSASASRCRVVLVPSFSQTGQIVLVNIQTLEVKTVKFDIDGLRKESI